MATWTWDPPARTLAAHAQHRRLTFVVLEHGREQQVHDDENNKCCVHGEQDEVEAVLVVQGHPHVRIVDRGDEHEHLVVP